MAGVGPGAGLFILRPIKKTLKSPEYFLSAFSVKTFPHVKGSSIQPDRGFPGVQHPDGKKRSPPLFVTQLTREE